MSKTPIKYVRRRARRRRGSHYPNELSQAVEMLIRERVREVGAWKVKSIEGFRRCMLQVVSDTQYWRDMQGLMDAAKKLNYRVTEY